MKFFALVRLFCMGVAVSLLVTGCASRQDSVDAAEVALPDASPSTESFDSDPLEPFNRVMFDFNNFLDALILRPLASLYGTLVPDPLRRITRNFLLNLGEPLTFSNNLLQLNVTQAFSTLVRFTTNSTLGLGGFFDVSHDWGYPRQEQGFADTMALYGIPKGPYLHLPFLGPSSPRSLLGMIGDASLHPLRYVRHQEKYPYKKYNALFTAIFILDARHRTLDIIDDLQSTSLDYYTSFRIFYEKRGVTKDGLEDVSFDDLPSIDLLD